MIGFLEESEGVHSMARLTIAWMCVLATVVVAAGCYCLITGKLTEGMACALGGWLLTIVAKAAVAIINRNGSDADK